MKSNNKTLIAFALVMLMLAVPLTAVAPSEDSDAASVVPAGTNYAYLVTYSTESDKTQSQITGVYKDGNISGKTTKENPVNLTGNGLDAKTVEEINGLSDIEIGTTYKMSDAGTITSGDLTVVAGDLVQYNGSKWVKYAYSWTWNDGTGLGPFNMFYAAISVGNNASDKNAYSNTPGHIAHILKPSDLTKDVKGNAVDLSKFNVMLVIPTIYWYSDGAGNLYISNTNTNSNLSSVNNLMKAYAHQVDDATIYPYLAIGVYEATIDSTYGLMSKNSSTTPAASKTLSGFRAEVEKANSFVTDGAGTYQMWNFYEWTLYKIISQATIGSKNAQAQIGGGNAYGTWGDGKTENHASVVAKGDEAGPYAASGTSGTASYSKLYIENAWGSVWEFVDNTYVSGEKLKAGSGLTTGLYGTSDVLNSGISGADYTGGDLSVPAASNTKITSHVLTPAAWDMPATADGTGESDYASGDNMWSNNSGNRCLFVGGSWNHGASDGLSAWSSNAGLSYSNAYVGARLAYLMTAD
ncbi:MAG: hypothetical protein IKQ93_06925, partial [Candidatus Methanomethylophilaceae archaeon]|nr:hypothetical protein [Candidatus Methanomethylophilaceae archaeon]